VDQSTLEANLADIGPLEFEQVRRTVEEKLFNHRSRTVPLDQLPGGQLGDLGLAGLGKDSRSKNSNRYLKEVLGYPLRKDFRQLLGKV
jgi:hypothetical protein